VIISIDDQIKCIAREGVLRKNVYKSRVAKGRMSQAESDTELTRMRAVLRTLKAVRELDPKWGTDGSGTEA
jgi:hypothetical protein